MSLHGSLLRDERDAFADWLRTQGLRTNRTPTLSCLDPSLTGRLPRPFDAGVLIRVVGPGRASPLRASIGTPEEMARLRAALTSAIGR